MIKRLLIVGVVLLLVLSLSLETPVFAENEEQPKVEMRAAWIATVVNIDMPAGMSEAEFTEWAMDAVGRLAEMHFNTVIFQVKPTSDALYPSELAPWSRYITGKEQGTDPGYDPLQIMLDITHGHGMELHAWINPYRVTMPGQDLDDLAPDHIAKKHPDWVVKYGQQYYFNPGIPEVQQYLIETVKELVTNYDIDAVHMDDYFYPYKIAGEEFPDEEAFEEYGEGFSDIEDWRRNNVNELVYEINQAIKEMKSWVQFGISPFGVWRNIADDPTGSDTEAGQTNYDHLYADTRQWIRDGSIDYITPQIYWSRQFMVANYSILLDWWSREVTTYSEVHPVNLYIGMADYKVNDNFDEAWDNPYELPEQILDNRFNGVARGQMHFSMKDVFRNALGYADILQDEIYHTKALTPATPWNGNRVPKKPISVMLEETDDVVKVVINNKKRKDVRKYIVYRFEGNKRGDYENPEHIIGVVYDNDGQAVFIDKDRDPHKRYTYGVTSVSPTGIESKGAKERKTKNK